MPVDPLETLTAARVSEMGKAIAELTSEMDRTVVRLHQLREILAETNLNTRRVNGPDLYVIVEELDPADLT